MFEIVLAGVGHTNAHVVRQWGFAPIPNARLTCVSPYVDATYSGMLPGVLAGLYAPSDMRIDLRRLCEAVGARLVVGEAIGCDVAARRLMLADGTTLPYDVLSIGCGSHARLPSGGADAPSLVPIKPMQSFIERFDARLAVVTAASADGPSPSPELHVIIAGSGVGGTEIALCLQPHLERRLGQHKRSVTLIGSGPQPASAMGPRAGRWLEKELCRRGIDVLRGARVARVAADQVGLDDGRWLPAEVVIWAADAVATEFLGKLDLPHDERGFLLTRPTLQSTARDDVFVVGDAGTIVGEPLTKAGVYAVREGPVLWENLRRFAANRPLADYRPQRRFLKLLNLGNGRGLGEYFGWTFHGRWVWRWKDRIDRRFMALYQR